MIAKTRTNKLAETTVNGPLDPTATETVTVEAAPPADAQDLVTATVDSLDGEGVEEVDPWASLPDAEEATFTRGPLTVDVEKETPARIKADLRKSFDGYQVHKSGDDTKPGLPKWLTQKFPTTDMAGQYLKLAERYAKFNEWTLRAVWMDDNGVAVPKSEKRGTKTLRFCAKPKETRTKVEQAVAPEVKEESTKEETGF